MLFSYDELKMLLHVIMDADKYYAVASARITLEVAKKCLVHKYIYIYIHIYIYVPFVYMYTYIYTHTCIDVHMYKYT